MKKSVAYVLIVILFLAGCSARVSQTDYDALLAERDAALAENKKLKAEVAQLMQTNEPQATNEPSSDDVNDDDNSNSANNATDNIDHHTIDSVSTDIEMIYFSKENMRPTLIDTSDIKVKFNKFGYSNSKSVYKLNFIVENDTEHDINVVLTDVTVNGYDISSSTGKSLVEPHHKANCDSSTWQKYIDETGESEWDVMEGVIEVRDGYWGDAIYAIPVVIEKACWEYEEEYAKSHPVDSIISKDLDEIPSEAIVLSSDNLYPALLKEDDVTASVNAYAYANSKTVFKIKFELENNTSEDLNILLTDVVIDGYDISTSTGKSLVEAGHKAICDSSIWMRDMEEVGITDWIVLKGNIEVRKGLFGDTVFSVPVVIYRNAWDTAY